MRCIACMLFFPSATACVATKNQMSSVSVSGRRSRVGGAAGVGFRRHEHVGRRIGRVCAIEPKTRARPKCRHPVH